MINLTEYASLDSVRAALGVSALEAPDAVLSSDIYAYFVQTELDGISSTLRSEFEAITPPGTGADMEKYDAVRVFAAYAIAYTASDSLPNFSPKTIVEGKASTARHSDSPYKSVIIEVRKKYLLYKKMLENFIEGSVAATTAPTLLSISTPDYDPVTGA